MKIGIVGLPNVGKSTMFNAITKAGAECANYPFCTIEPNIGMVPVPDERLDNLAKIYNPEKITHAVIEFVDIAGLVKGASKGEGLGNKFLSHIRETDAIVQVVRCFEDSNVVHVDGSVDPIRDIETINLELIFADIETVNKRLEKAKKNLKANKKYQEEIDLLEKIKQNLEEGKSARAIDFNEDEQEMVKEMFLDTEVYVFEKEGVIQGFVGVMEDYIAGIFVKRAARSTGIGKELLDYVKDRKPRLTLSVYQKMKMQSGFIREKTL